MTGFLGGSLIGVGQGGAIDTGDIQKSLRFAASRSTYASRTFGTPTNSLKWTWSGWVKRSKLGTLQFIFAMHSANNDASYCALSLTPSNTIRLSGFSTLWRETSQVSRDPSGYINITVAVDTTQGVASDRILIYAGGFNSAAFLISNNPTQNTAIGINTAGTHHLGAEAYIGPQDYLDGYLSRVCFVDGAALTPSSFGYLNTEINEWVSKSQSAVKAVVDAGGANSFMLDFDDGTSLTTLGYDKSSKGNNWTLNNHSLTSGVNYDWMDDVPGNSFATLNGVHPSRSTLSNGNLTASGTTDFPTITPDSGTWYFERGGVSQTWTPPAAFPSGSGDYNFGQRPWQSTGPTGGQKALNQHNLTAIPTALLDPTDHHIDITVTKSGDTNFTLPWGASTYDTFFEIKRRDAAGDWYQIDGLRGYDKILKSNGTAAETTDALVLAVSGTTCTLKSTLANGTYVISATKAGLTASRQTNTDGSITSTVSRNVDSGFAIVTYTGTGANATVGHGLGAVVKMLHVKNRDVGGNGWVSYHTALSNTEALFLHATNAKTTFPTAWNSTSATSSVFSLGTDVNVNQNTIKNVAYCYADSAIQKSFSYVGNASADGPYVNLGFKCGRVVVKNATTGGANYDWWIVDSTRNPTNVVGNKTAYNLSDAELLSTAAFDFASNGVKVRTSAYGSINGSGNVIIGHAWASVTGKYSNAK